MAATPTQFSPRKAYSGDEKNVFSFDLPVTWEQIDPSDFHADTPLDGRPVPRRL